MFIRSAYIQLKHGGYIRVDRQEAQRLFEREREESIDTGKLVIMSAWDSSLLKNEGPIVIPASSISFIAFEVDEEAERLEQTIRAKWEEIIRLTGVDDDAGCDWFTDGQNTYIGSEDWKVSNDPYVAKLLIEIEDLEDQLSALRG